MPIWTRPTALVCVLTAAACSGGVPSVTQAPVAPPASASAASAPVAALVAAPVTGDAAGADVASHAALVPALDGAVFRDERHLPPRALGLVVVEIQQLESLLQVTPATSADRPLLLRRLAEEYVELEKAAGATAAASAGAGIKTPHAARAPVVERARQEAIRHYTTLLLEYSGHPSPAFPSSAPPAYPQLDEVLYELAYEHERAGDGANARRAYFEVITRWPASRLVPRVYLAFGDMFFGEAMADPGKWELASAAYTKVLATPPPGNDVYGYAWYRLAYVLANQGDRDGALKALQKAVDWSTAFPTVPGAAPLGAEAEHQREALSP
jgi:tetratricopeptide (TPR) repeat protein